MDKMLEDLNELEFEDANKNIKYWFDNKASKILNVISYPFNELYIFNDVIKEVINNNNNVLYMTCKKENEEIIKYLEECNINHCHIEEYDENKAVPSVILSEVNILTNIKGRFGLVIIDDISGLSCLNNVELLECIDVLYNKCDKMIIYSYDNAMKNVDSLYVGSLMRSKPIIEPRIITTRIDLSSDMPYIAYDYIKMFKKKKRKLFIFVPDEDKRDDVYNYLSKKLNIEEKSKLICSNDRNNIREEIECLEDEPLIVVSSDIYYDIKDIQDTDVIIYYSDDASFDTKKLVYICGEVGYKDKEGEVLLLSNNISRSMEESKEITRKYNKHLWKRGLV